MDWGERFLIHQWSDGYVVFDQHTGNTHALDLMAGQAFVAAQDGDDIEEAVQNAALALHPRENPEELARLIQDCCARLATCGFAEFEKHS